MVKKGPNLQKAVDALADLETPNLSLPKKEWDKVLGELGAYQASFDPPGETYVYPQTMTDGSTRLTPKAKPHWWDGRKFFLLKGRPVYLEGSDDG